MKIQLLALLIAILCVTRSHASPVKSSFFDDELLLNTADIYLKLSQSEQLSLPQQVTLAKAQYFLDLESGLAQTLENIDSDSLSVPIQKYTVIYLKVVSLFQAGNYQQSKFLIEQTLPELQRHKLLTLEVMYAQELARIYAILENFKKSYELINHYHFLAKNNDLTLALGLIEYTNGLVNYFNDDPAGALPYYENALLLFKQIGYPYYIADAYLGFATSYTKLGKFEAALEAYNEYEKTVRFRKGIGSLFYMYYGKAKLFQRRGMCDEALIQITNALDSEGPDDYKLELHKITASCQLSGGNIIKAREAVEQANHIIVQQPELAGTVWEADLVYIDAQVAIAEGDYASAIILLEHYINVFTEVSQKNYSIDLAKLKEEFSSQQKDLEIQILEQRSMTQLFVAIIIGLIALLFLGIAFWYRKKSDNFFKLSNTDALTGIFNRRYALQLMNNWMTDTLSPERAWCLAIMDIDNFKSVNDKYGHNIGDDVIQMVASTSRETLRPTDTVARFGGEEFILGMTRLGKDEAFNVLDRIRRKIASKVVSSQNRDIQITVSIGMVMVDSNSKSIKEWISLADKALYRAKHCGKDNVQLITPER